ncbi:MAG: LCP family protein [Pedococcus sp.]
MSRTTAPSPEDDEARVYVSGRAHRTLADADVLGAGMRHRRALTLVLLTLVVPGSAQIVAGNRRLGRFAVRVWLALIGLVAVLGLAFLASHTFAIGLLGRGGVLAAMEWLILGYAGLWALLFVDAWRLGRPSSLVVRARRTLTAVTAVMLVVTSGGLVYAAGSVGAGKDALGALFSQGEAVGAVDGRYNVLLLGADTGKNRVGTRPDSIQLVSLDAKTGAPVTFGFSRDTENINFRPGSTMARLIPEGWNCGDECLLNGLYTWAQDHASLFPPGTANPGVLATREAVEALSGLSIQYYVMIDLKGFQKMVDAVGGLDITVKYRTPIGGGSSPILGGSSPAPSTWTATTPSGTPARGRGRRTTSGWRANVAC